MAAEIFYRNGIELPLTPELLAIFLLPTPAVFRGSGDEGGGKMTLGDKIVTFISLIVLTTASVAGFEFAGIIRAVIP
jgi:hypothetical protein